ncbi:alpha/beta hydrolase fold domain-containing protein [Mycolicibacterium vaccae]|uniref:Alpha/beta hydrolase domain-containing protein n=1 Tax=Mycolicibacterium vaccae ATCC 25954 TaxID=1194972 RepID=K0V444_MYCVA|nr:alpha/beta hydrolase [Mycolicibacterium vaccae]ANI38094.1 alpha/beta hydrolase domain-containing protein [Mycolicibacterium vaccae 95051]EJZ12225.1 alpha/beta hydrolase domain-containing protein [Mycolicibacterium vaccae ATCC 25954]
MSKHLAGALGATFVAAASTGVVLAFAPTAAADTDTGSETTMSAEQRPSEDSVSAESPSSEKDEESVEGEEDSVTPPDDVEVSDDDEVSDDEEVPEDEPVVEPEDDSDPPDVEPDDKAPSTSVIVEAPDHTEAPREQPEEDLVDVVGSVVLAGSARTAEVDAEPPPDADTVVLADPPAPAAEDVGFTGRPSFVASVVTVVLRLVKPVLQLFGIELNGTTARIPFFTDGIPPFFVRARLTVTSEDYEGWKTWTLAPRRPSGKVVVGVHGGSFISTASLFHWSTYASLARRTGATVVVPLYRLANAEGTGGTAKTVVPVMADFIAEQVARHGRDNVSVLGDSAGGSIGLAASQMLVARCGGDPECLAETLPGRLVLLSPALDASASNPNIALVDDPLLSPASSKRNGQWWAKGLETEGDPTGTRHPLASPIYGSLEGLPPTTVYAGSLDLRTPDVLVLQQKAVAAGADVTFRLRNGQIHDWMIFGFLPDARRENANLDADLGL